MAAITLGPGLHTIRLTASGGTVTVSSVRAGADVVVDGQPIGFALTAPDGSISICVPGSVITVSPSVLDGVISKVITGEPVALPLAVLTGIVSVPPAAASSRLVLPGPLYLWDGTRLIESPPLMFDGNSLN